MKVFENWRTFVTSDSFETNVICSLCLKPSEAYLELVNDDESPFVRICKTCLNRGDELVSKRMMRYMKEAKRI